MVNSSNDLSTVIHHEVATKTPLAVLTHVGEFFCGRPGLLLFGFPVVGSIGHVSCLHLRVEGEGHGRGSVSAIIPNACYGRIGAWADGRGPLLRFLTAWHRESTSRLVKNEKHDHMTDQHEKRHVRTRRADSVDHLLAVAHKHNVHAANHALPYIIEACVL